MPINPFEEIPDPSEPDYGEALTHLLSAYQTLSTDKEDTQGFVKDLEKLAEDTSDRHACGVIIRQLNNDLNIGDF